MKRTDTNKVACELVDSIRDNTVKEITTSIPELAYWLKETAKDYGSTVVINLVD